MEFDYTQTNKQVQDLGRTQLALDFGQRGTKAVQSLFKEMTRPVFWQHPMQPMRSVNSRV